MSLRGGVGYPAALVPEPVLFPEPRSLSYGNTTLHLQPGATTCRLEGRAAASGIVSRAATRYFGQRGLTFPWGSRGAAPAPAFVISIDVTSADEELQLGVDEAYSLSVSAGSATLTASTVWGALRGMETLSQLIVPVPREAGGGYRLPRAPWAIHDRPRFPWRALMLDTARRFYPVAVLEGFLDAMAQNKFNVLHWHATDAESVPLASTAFPNLTMGAFGAEATYSPADVDGLLAYAKDRGIRVVLELDMPGHNWAYSAAFPHLFANCSASGHLASPTEFWQDAFDVTQPALYEFLDRLLGEMASRFPDSIMHTGGDEVSPSCWENNSRIVAWLADHGMNSSELYPYFEEKVSAILRKHGKSMMAWDDVFQKSPSSVVAGQDVVHAWRSPALAQQAGQRVVTSHKYYLTAGDGPDTSYAITWEDIFARDPADLSANTDGTLISDSPNFLGAEGCVWGTSVWAATLDSLVWPRAAVLAERLWSHASRFGTDAQGKPDWHGAGPAAGYKTRLIMWMCQMLRRGVRPTPPDDRDHFPRRSLWEQCELDLPPPHPTGAPRA